MAQVEVDWKWFGVLVASFSFFFWHSSDFYIIIALLVSVFVYREFNPSEDEVVAVAPKKQVPHWSTYVQPAPSTVPQKSNATTQLEGDTQRKQDLVTETSDPTETQKAEADGAEERRLTLEESTAETEALYKKHRAEADEHAKLRAKYFDEAAEAHKQGDGKKAKELSEMGKEQTKLMEEASLSAANAIFQGKNLRQPKGTIDLHGLQVKEAEMIVARELTKAKEEGLTELKVIIGAGRHSDAAGPKVGPAVKKMLTDDSKVWRDDVTNTSGGTIIVTL